MKNSFRFCRCLARGPDWHCNQSGFSLHDLLTTSAVAGVLSLGAVSMNGLVQDTRMTAAINQIMGDLSLARSEAVKRGSRVAICRSNDGLSCSGSAWNEGWIVFSDANKNYKLDDDENLILVQQGMPGDMTLRYGGEKMSYARLAYYPEGYARPNATFTLCNGRGSAKAKAVIINTVGRPRVSGKTLEDKPLTCS